MSEYNATDIQTLSPGRAFRERLGMYLSADLQEAMDLGLRELIYNAQDEYEATHQKNAYVKIQISTDTNEITVSDNMRGIPVGVRKDGVNSLTAAFLIPHSGAKYNDKTAYSSSVGCNGEGNKIVCHTAQWLKVEVSREGNRYFQSFHETDEGAVPDCEVKIIGKTKETGTKITYIPSPKVYGEDTRIDIDNLCDTLQQLSYFSKGLKIILNVDGDESEFYSKNGLLDGLDKTHAIGHQITYLYSQSDCEVELALQWVGNKGEVKGYANNLFMPQGGAFISGFKTSLTRTFNSIAGTNYDGDTIRSKLEGFVSVKVHIANFSNQAKTSLANPEARTATSAAITAVLKEYAQKYPNDFQKVLDIMSKEQKATEAAEKARNAILNHEKEMSSAKRQKSINSPKLSEARKLGADSILLLVEGESSGGSMARGRQAAGIDNIGILKLRGKCINPFTHSLEEVLANEEVKLLCQALGIVYGKPLNEKKLRYGKIAICVDADDDGAHIALLILSLVNFLCPEYLTSNRMYWLRCPLFKQGKNYYYTYEEFIEAERTSKAQIIRFKGVGQLEGTDLKETMFNPQKRHLEPITFEDDGLELLQDLMGSSVEPRKDFVFNCIDFGGIKIG